MTKLHLGCGDVILPGWINLDAVQTPRVDVVDDVRTLTSIPRESVDTMYACCLLEHFSHRDTKSLLTLWKSKLRSGGTIRISVPDFSAITAEYSATQNLPRLLGLLIGGQKDNYDRHGAIFDYDSLAQILREVGFSDIHRYDWTKTDHAEHDDYASAYLPHMDPTGRLMSLNVEARVPLFHSKIPEWYVLGDSHGWVFTQAHAHPGLFDPQTPVYSLDQKILVNRLGPWLAWYFGSEEGQDIVDNALKDIPKQTKIILSFGEIDCRSKVVPIAENNAISIEAASLAVVQRYFQAAQRIQRAGYKVYFWNAPPQTGGPCYNPVAPVRGTYAQCRHAIECFNGHLRKLAESSGMGFIDIYDSLVHGSRTTTHMFSDHIHLDPRKVWPAIAEKMQ